MSSAPNTNSPPAERTDSSSPREPRLLGVTLAQFAAVEIGLAEGFAPADVLRVEGVNPADWERAREAWEDRLADAPEDDPLALDDLHSERLARARERYGRRVDPLDDDPLAFFAFVRAWTSAPEPSAFLTERGLRPTDILRLQGRWLKELGRDPALQAHVESEMRAGTVFDRPIHLGDPVLPAPAAPATDCHDLEPPPTWDVPEDDENEEVLDDAAVSEQPPVFQPFAALLSADAPASATPPLAPSAPGEIEPEPVSIAAAGAHKAALPSFMLEAKPEPAPADLGHTTFATSPFAASAPALPFADAPPADLNHTVMATSPLAGPALPFQHGTPAAAPAPPAPGENDLNRTVMATSLPAGPALPFQHGSRAAAAPPPISPPLDHTTVASGLPSGPALPFQQRGSTAASSEGAAVPIPTLTVEQWVSLYDDMATGDRAATLARYQVSAAQYRALQAEWTRRALHEPETARRLAEALQKYREWKASRR